MKELIILGGGCFWCVEAIFLKIKGVSFVSSGYSGGTVENPTYEQVCTGKSGHIEVVKVEFDNSVITLEQILEVFFNIHDPTQFQRQGNDIGYQYQSSIFTFSQAQRQTAIDSKNYHEKNTVKTFTTLIEDFKNFYPAESYHINYFELNQDNKYCQTVVSKKVLKFLKEYSNILK